MRPEKHKPKWSVAYSFNPDSFGALLCENPEVAEDPFKEKLVTEDLSPALMWSGNVLDSHKQVIHGAAL